MRYCTLLLLACCIGLSGGLSCTTRQASTSTAQTSDSQAAVAAAKAQKEQEAADAKAVKKAAAEAKLKQEQEDKARKKQEAADAKALKKAQEEAARQAKAGKPAPSTMSTNLTATPAPVPAVDPNAPLTKEQKLNDLNRRYKNDEITPLEYQTERAKIMAEP